ncbi:MAG: hypothetical protein KAT54_00790, partial [Candidatus Marinimicrobia bacterium]|nr:hypothetical protein [Candidatus Neomarinimicrobiota bacterium]
VYTIATNNYIIGHADRFWGLNIDDITVEDTGIIGRDILVKAVAKQKVINSATGGRLIFTTDKVRE